MQNLISDYTVT